MRNALFVAVVHTPETVELIAVSARQDALLDRLAQYVSSRAAHTLWASDAAQVQSLLASNQRQAAVDHYFAAVGNRWDAEWLVTTSAEPSELATA